MRLTTITLAIALGLGTVSMTTVGMAFGNHSEGGQSVHAFGHHPFHNRFRFHKKFVIPYPYYDYGYPTDYDYPTDAFGDYPSPIVIAPPSSPSCHRSEETFAVPSESGGTRQVRIINCP
jgi:hypothetical protein